MKAWFVFLINGKKIGTWANNTDEARTNLIAEYGDVEMEYLGIRFGYNGIGPAPDKYIYRGMSACDIALASGMLNMLCRLRR